MITTADIIRLPYSPDLTEGGIALAVRSLSQNFDRSSASLYARLRSIVSSVAVELAFRRTLNERGTPFEVKSALSFSDPDRYEVSLGGHRCSINTDLVSRRSQIGAIRRDPGLLLKAQALIPEERLSAVNLTGKELLFFAFLLGLTTRSPGELQKVAAAGQPMYLVHPLRVEWANPPVWAPLGPLAFKSECAAPVTIELGGQDAQRNFISETLTLDPLTRTLALNNYYSLAYLHAHSLPGARLGLRSPARNEVYLVQPHEWENIWVYGLEIWLAGYISEQDFRRKASTTSTGSRVFQYSQIQARNLSVPVSDLHSLEDLLVRVKNWEAQKKSWQ